MNKIGFVFSCICSLLGVMTFLATTILNIVMPKLGRVAYQAAAAGSYSSSDYQMNFGLVNFSACVLLFGGIALALYFYRTKNL